MLKQLSLVFFIGFVSCTSIEKAKEVQEKEDLGWNFSETSGGGNYQVNSPAFLKVKVTDNGATDENDDWKFCTWTRLRDGAYCRFSYECDGTFCSIGVGDFTIRKTCTMGLENRVKFFGEDPNESNQVCGLEIPSVTRDDSSEWRVNVEECRVTGCGTSDGNGNVITTSVNVIVN